jgi:hypothetical protein
MPKKIVHIFPLLRVTLTVEANSDVEAIEKAMRKFYDEELWRDLSEHGEFADDLDDAALVDQVGDKEYENSRWYTWLKDGTWTEGLPEYDEKVAKEQERARAAKRSLAS